MAKIFKKIINVVYIIIILALILYFALRLCNKIDIYSVETGSMEDNIHAGDYILIYKGSNYKMGDVVTYKVGEYYVTHRIIQVNMDNVITKGDANNANDGKVNTSNIVGKVVLNGGILNVIVKYKYFLAGIFLLIYLFSCYISSKQNKQSNTIISEENLDKKVDEAVAN